VSSRAREPGEGSRLDFSPERVDETIACLLSCAARLCARP